MLARKIGVISVIVGLTVINTFAADKPLKVYIMSGQSNMQGMADVTTLPAMADDPLSKELYNTLVNADGKPKVFEDVRVAALTGGRRDPVITKTGPLSIGFGGGLGEDGTKIGTEFAFGAIMYENLKEPILIIKASWGGKSLNTDFRSPSAGPYFPFPETVQDRKGNSGNLITAKAQIDAKLEKTGVYYRRLIEHVKTVLADPKKFHPAYDPKNGYEIAGFIWLQGFNDLIDKGLYSGKGDEQYAEYTTLMAHFIRDVRKDLQAPKMPFVIGVLGIGGATNGPFQKAQAAAADMPEFMGNVTAVLMGKYWDSKLSELAERKDRKSLTDEERAYCEAGASNASFHYLGSAKIYSRVGEAFAEAIVNMKKNGK